MSRSSTGTRFHPAFLIISGARGLRAVIPLLILSVIRFPLWALLPLAGLVAAGAIASWWRTTYSVQDRVLRLESGIFSRKIRTVPASRITALASERGLIQRLFNVWELKVQTPGDGEHATVSLTCLTTSEVERVRRALQGGSSSAERRGGEIVPPATLATLGIGTLLVTAVTGTSLPLILVGLVTVYNRARDLLPDGTTDYLEHEVFDRGRGTALILVVLCLLAVAVGVLLTALRIARFTLARADDHLQLSRGLLAQRRSIIPVDRVQAVRLVDGLARRALGFTAIEVEVAGLSARDSSQRTLFPLIRRSKARALLQQALPELRWNPVPLHTIPRRGRRRYLTLPLLTGLALSGAIFIVPTLWADAGWTAPGWLVGIGVLPRLSPLPWGWPAPAPQAGRSIPTRWSSVPARFLRSTPWWHAETECSSPPWPLTLYSAAQAWHRCR
ncbi:hypothetical protein EH165_10405 [Nakamurella antarctica]|uniref:YdbS-like PH domain-containing protein n=1 Tax=Nakamurella antarctica TaxID=1902245 RepID=A0A3G8ZNX9_9ACTN|nr:PH domain-containing protein [Nakamurella antarctica]AZI58485.1 hypothetical protein EH165_10405 [Nakamurella antarctica]